MIKYIGYAVLVLLVLWFLYKMFYPVKGLKTLQAGEFAEQSKGQLIVDVREVHEYKRGHLVKAVNVPLSQFKSRLAEIPKDKPVYLYCQSGMRSKQAASQLSANGYTEVYHLQGGILTWKGNVVK